MASNTNTPTFPFPRIPPTTVRFLRVKPLPRYTYTFEYYNVVDLPNLPYQLVSYHDPFHPHSQQVLLAAPPTEIYRPITINSTTIFVPPYLHAFIDALHNNTVAAARRSPSPAPSTLWFLPPLCLDPADRPSYLNHQAAPLSRHARRTVAWLGPLPHWPLEPSGLAALAQLVQREDGGYQDARTAAGAGAVRRNLAEHPHWSTLDAVRDLLLCEDVERRMEVWCHGGVPFPVGLFGAGTCGPFGGAYVEVSAAERVLEFYSRSRFEEVCYSTGGREGVWTGPLPGTLADTMAELEGRARTKVVVQRVAKKPGEEGKTVSEVVGGGLLRRLECEDKRDRLYGLVDILRETSRSKVVVDYERGVEWAFEQALLVGLEELAEELASDVVDDLEFYWTGGRNCSWVQTYYREARGVFGVDEDEGDRILRRVVKRMGLKKWHAHIDMGGGKGLSFGEFRRVSAKVYRPQDRGYMEMRWSKMANSAKRRMALLARLGANRKRREKPIDAEIRETDKKESGACTST
ncbi:hypothetical protein B0T18DRAFT_425599 [Schizothecium vesticola]|uniref:Uncharacterized protein n=1 Tax=Schizothecium vesticola TaxID=314040 RepID=A0AA40F4C7_9PEZI|nr:hypothetical protein B0T18DRAFT_425599 [Schizothecium vesticola]